ncbi:MAG: pyridoxal phosphate-dependent decarboxylase family protein [Polyangiales bacterium]
MLDFVGRLSESERALLEEVENQLREGQVHPTNPLYFGLFNQSPSPVAVAAEALVATYNPQLAAFSHAPWPVSIEAELVRAFGAKFGYAETEGSFTSGGAEANVTAVLAALTHAFPSVTTRGVRSLERDPIVYVSAEAHPTVARAVRIAGLGSEAVRVIPADAKLRMKTASLREAAFRERPFLIVATAGTTSAGTVDPLPEIANIAEKAGCWLHVDAAYGGLAALVPELRPLLDGIERADSITFDPHKTLAVPMSAGMYLSRRVGTLAKTFADHAGYMPRDASADPYAHSFAWSRRFNGLKVHVTIASRGWDGVAAMLRKQVALGERLREKLRASGWSLKNETKLPVVCFGDDREAEPRGARVRSLDAVARAVIAGGAWLSVTKLSTGVRALRACITNHETTEEHVDMLVALLDRARLGA